LPGTQSLRSSFPVTVRLVGGDYFRDAARQLQQTQASSSGDLANVGEAFSVFLQQRHQADRFCYLADVARFEWLCQKSKLAAGHACLDLIKLASVPRADYDELHFVLHPSVELFESSIPEAAMSADPAFDAAEILHRHVMAHTIVDFHPAGTCYFSSRSLLRWS
jgi:hypothetical protein